ncbi:MAG: SDR family oxidoreductase, partial [Halobacteria archaeon]|nr:SDR family oxidoreductase [Halobacteria archaeon]
MGVFDQFRIDGDTALVTGAASGIGKAYSTALAEAGANLALVDIDSEGVDELAGELEEEWGIQVKPIEADVTVEDDCRRMVEDTLDEFGSLDICFANAGVSGNGTSLMRLSMDEWDDIIDVNLRGAFMTAREAAVPMIENGEGNGQGRIIFTASMLGFIAEEVIDLAPYVASKGGVVQLTKQFATELSPEVRVNAIAPGFVQTNIGHGILTDTAAQSPAIEELHEKIEDRSLLGRMAEPSELKPLAVFLASPASSYCTGGVYLVDGGTTAV